MIHAIARPMTALALTIALATPAALAANHLSVSATSAPFAEAPDLVGLDLAWDAGLVIVLGDEGTGGLGDAMVPNASVEPLPTDALGSVIVDEALGRTGVLAERAGGVQFVVDATSPGALADAFAARLEALGFGVAATPSGRVLTFERDGASYRATFATQATGVQVYIGPL